MPKVENIDAIQPRPTQSRKMAPLCKSKKTIKFNYNNYALSFPLAKNYNPYD